MRWTRPLGAVAIVVLVALVVASAWMLGRLVVSVPAGAGTTVIAHAVMTGLIDPDASPGADPESFPRSPVGQQCLDSIERPAGRLDLCWAAYRDPGDADPVKDYYRLRVYGSFGFDTGTGIRWVVVQAHLVGEPSNDVFDYWPKGVYEGGCHDTIVGLKATLADQPEHEMLCGRTTSEASPGALTQRVTWTCESCLFPDQMTRAISLYQFLAVPAGTVPAWEISADLGG